jgi:Ser/Thr protein kinase RdoA (MazF antagonist)
VRFLAAWYENKEQRTKHKSYRHVFMHQCAICPLKVFEEGPPPTVLDDRRSAFYDRDMRFAVVHPAALDAVCYAILADTTGHTGKSKNSTMMALPVGKSLFSAVALARLVEDAYGCVAARCHLISASMRDVYLVAAGQQRYVLYIYRSGRRTPEEITAEWQFVAELAAQNMPVAPAIPTSQGELLLALAAPEGPRYAVLTGFIAGQSLRRRSRRQAVLTYGRQIATMHLLADRLALPLHRPVIGLAALVEQAITALAVIADDRPDAVADLQECAGRVCVLLPREPGMPPEYGLIHGDVIRANALVDNQGTVSILDFDLCGYGWRAYDIASYLCAIRGAADEVEYADAFLTGYQEMRPLSAWEQALLPLFEAARAIFGIGVPAIEVDQWGSAYLYSFLDHELAQLKRTMQRIGA